MKLNPRSFKQYAFILLLLALIVLGLFNLIQDLKNWKMEWWMQTSIVGLLYFISALLHGLLIKKANIKPSTFISLFMASQSIKLFSYLIQLVVLVLLNKPLAVPICILYLMVYLLFSAWDVVHLLLFFNQEKQKES
jgi:hypothetical protein